MSLGSLNTLAMRFRPPSQQMVPLMGSEARTPCFESFICYFLNITVRLERPALPPLDPHSLTVGYIDCPRIVRKDVCMRTMPCIPGILSILFYICIETCIILRTLEKIISSSYFHHALNCIELEATVRYSLITNKWTRSSAAGVDTVG